MSTVTSTGPCSASSSQDGGDTACASAYRLADGRTVTIRPIRRDDRGLEAQFLSRLCPESRYLRFHAWVAAPSERLIHFLNEIDQAAHVAYVCTSATQGIEEIVGEGRYAVEPDTRSCEFGIVIADAWHKSGIAGLLMHALIRKARASGLERMVGIVLRSNRAMLRFARALGFDIVREPDSVDTVRVVKRL